MVLVLTRSYAPTGTNGMLCHQRKVICATIELPWKDNHRRISCIPEGEYFVEKRYSAKFGWHLEITDVPNRSAILFHPANTACTELQGCIAPVCQLTGAGEGLASRKAFTKLKQLVYNELDAKESVLLLVQS